MILMDNEKIIIRKKVKLINEDPSAKFVNHCPIYIRQWKTGPAKGKSYAFVYEDCLNCKHLVDIEYEKKWIDANGRMLNVLCCG